MSSRSRPAVSGAVLAVAGLLAMALPVSGSVVSPALGAAASPMVTSRGVSPASALPAWGPAYPVVLRPGAARGEDGVVASSVRRGTTLLHTVTGTLTRNAVLTYARSSHAGSSWSQRATIRRGRTGGVGVAAAGASVVVAWTEPPGSGARTLVVRVNDAYGRASRWSAPRRLARFSGAGDMSVAATSSTFLVALRTGAGIQVWAGRDGGRRWTRTRVSAVHCNRDDTADPLAVAASGRLAAVAWSCEGPSGIRISRDSGRHWSHVHRGPPAPGALSLTARDGRVVVSGTSDDEIPAVPVRTWWQSWADRSWAPVRDMEVGRDAQAVLLGGASLGFASVDDTGLQQRLRWTSSADLGRSWAEPVVVATVDVGDPPAQQLYGVRAMRGEGGSVHVLYNVFAWANRSSRVFVRSSVEP